MNRGKGPPARNRRKPVVGEDLSAIKNAMKEIKDQPITLDDFLTLISPHTGDKGASLIKVMTEDITAFRRMVIKVYDTMSQDVSDVLANEQMELAKVYSERQRLLMDKMFRCLQQISDVIENFDFKRYYADPEGYLGLLFKIADIPDDEEVEAAKRQLAYHRLQWLQSEGERLQSENVKLQQRLKELKKIQRAEITESIRVEKEAESKKTALEKQQTEMQNKLEELTEVLQDTIVAEEKQTIDKKKQGQNKALAKKTTSTTTTVAATGRISSKIGSIVPWNVKTAAEIEGTHVISSTVSQSTIASKKSQSSTNRSLIKPKGTLPRRPSTQPSATSSEIPVGPPSSKQPPAKAKTAFGSSVQPSTSRLRPPSTSRLRLPSKSTKPTSSTLKVPKPAAPGKKAAGPKNKKPAPAKDRPEWRDVDLREFEVPIEAEEVPMDIFRRPASAQPCPPTCGAGGAQPRQASLPRQASPPGEAGPSRQAPPPRQPSPPYQPAAAGPPKQAPPPRQASPPCPPTCGTGAPPSNRRGSAPRDSWGGFY